VVFVIPSHLAFLILFLTPFFLLTFLYLHVLRPAAVFMSVCAVASGDDDVSRHSAELIPHALLTHCSLNSSLTQKNVKKDFPHLPRGRFQECHCQNCYDFLNFFCFGNLHLHLMHLDGFGFYPK